MQRIHFTLITLGLLWSFTTFCSDLAQNFKEEYVSQTQIDSWLTQFNNDQDTELAKLLLQQIDFFTHSKLQLGLMQLHQQLLKELGQDGFLSTDPTKDQLEKVDFSKTLPAKSGDLVSYFYRVSNKIRAVNFHNLSDLEINAKSKDDRALVILDDYMGTGVQMLEYLGNEKNNLFKQYKKIYIATLVSNQSAVEKFKLMQESQNEVVADLVIKAIGFDDKDFQDKKRNIIMKVPGNKIKLITYKTETHIVNENAGLNQEQKDKLNDFLERYSSPNYVGEFSKLGAHTVFFYNSPNNLPELFWNSKATIADKSSWNPLFKRTEDLSIYEISSTIPINQQIW